MEEQRALSTWLHRTVEIKVPRGCSSQRESRAFPLAEISPASAVQLNDGVRGALSAREASLFSVETALAFPYAPRLLSARAKRRR